MQVQSNYSSDNYSSAAKLKTGAAGAEGSQKERAVLELERMLENLSRDASIRDRVTTNDDGTLVFDWSVGGTSPNARVANAIITELNGQKFNSSDDVIIKPSASDAALFKQMTSYNMVLLGGVPIVVDDNGFPPASADEKLVKEALDFVTNVACFRAAGYLQGDLTAENVGSFLSAFNLIGEGKGSAFVDRLLEELKKASEPSEVAATASTDDHVGDLLEMMSS